MRVVCGSVEEFLRDLAIQVAAGGQDCVLQRTVRVSVHRRPLDGAEKRDAVRFAVVLQASAVLAIGSDGQYLLQCGVDCGIDYEDASQDRPGSEEAEQATCRIKRFCEANGLEIGPGVIEV